MIAYNVTRNSFVSGNVRVAQNMWQRFRGLLWSDGLKENEGFLIPSCKGIHTFGMTYSIDALYLNEEGRIINLLSGCKPNLAGPVNWKTKSVLELVTGTIERSHTKLGDILIFEENPQK